MKKKLYSVPTIKVKVVDTTALLVESDTMTIGVGGEDNDPGDWAAGKKNSIWKNSDEE